MNPGGVDPSTFLALALLVFVLVLFLGIATFARLVEIQRELMVYIAGMNNSVLFPRSGSRQPPVLRAADL